MAIKGTVSVYDRCDVRGEKHYEPTLAIPPGGLSSLYFSSLLAPQLGHTSFQFDPAQPSECRSYGSADPIVSSYMVEVEENSSVWTTATDFTMGSPYNPILSPPPQLLGLDPAWRDCCTWGNENGGFWGELSCKLLQIEKTE